MALKLPGIPKLFGIRSNIFRTELFKFGNVNIRNTAGPPSGQWPEGSMFVNAFDKKLYIATSIRRSSVIPDILFCKFNGSAQDFSTSETKNDGVTAGTPNYNTGKYGSAIDMDGVNDKITWPFNIDPGSAVTISFFLKPVTLPNNNDEAYLFEIWKDANNYFLIELRNTSGIDNNPKIYVHWRGAGASVDQLGPYALAGHLITTGSWNHIYIRVIGDGTITVEVNESGKESDAGVSTIPSFTTENLITGYSTLNTSFGNGSYYIDDLKIFGSLRDNPTDDSKNFDILQWLVSPLFTLTDTT